MVTKIYDLSQLFWPGSIMWPMYAAPFQGGMKMSFSGVRSSDWSGKPKSQPYEKTGIVGQNHPGWMDMGGGGPFFGGAQEIQWGCLHVGTHLDAPVYCQSGGLNADQIPLENLYGTGVVLDFRHKKKWAEITAADLEKATPKIQAGDFVVINTGWQTWLTPDKAYEYYHQYPGLVKSGAEWLIKKKVKAIAGTWPTPDMSLCVLPKEWNDVLYQEYKREMKKEPPKGYLDQIEPCLVMLLNAGISCISNAGGDIDKITGKRLTLCAWPYSLEDADAAHVRLVGIEE